MKDCGAEMLMAGFSEAPRVDLKTHLILTFDMINKYQIMFNQVYVHIGTKETSWSLTCTPHITLEPCWLVTF